MDPLRDVVDGADPPATTKADEVRHLIEEQIVAGRLPAGAVLRQDELARRFRVSRTPVREALRQLAALGLVSFTPNKGVRVTALDRDDWAQTILARAALEGVAAEAAAGLATDDDLDRLDEVDGEFGRQAALLRRTDLTPQQRSVASYEWVEANDRFHTMIVRLAGLTVFERQLDGLRRVFSGEASWSPRSAADQLYECNPREHAAVRAALRARNGRAARSLMEQHILQSWALLEAVLDESHPTPAALQEEPWPSLQ
ncbi:MAG: GntR family transcriptional regulator [Nocardioides sp.]